LNPGIKVSKIIVGEANYDIKDDFPFICLHYQHADILVNTYNPFCHHKHVLEVDCFGSSMT